MATSTSPTTSDRPAGSQAVPCPTPNVRGGDGRVPYHAGAMTGAQDSAVRDVAGAAL